jgi:DnaT DNA-binding domain
MKPELITNEFTPSHNLIQWCEQMGISNEVIKRERLEFIFWHTENKRRRSNFNLAFKNWLKKTMLFSKKQEDAIKKGSQSFGAYQAIEHVEKNRKVGRKALDKLLGRIK